jgi:WD40 repeat protein
LARALGSLHANGLVHRDIKPSNIVVVGGVPKLADVGLVAAASEGLTFVGTEGFVPPEGPGAPAADVFSLGKVLYELATGLDRQDFPRLPPNLSAWPDRRSLLELNEVLLRACEPIATNRFGNASTLLDELLLLQAGKSVRRLRNAERRTARALRVAAALAVFTAVAGTGAWIERKRLTQETDRRRAAETALTELARKTFYSASLGRSQRAIERGDYGAARRILNALSPRPGETDPRNFEWGALKSEANGDEATVLRDQGPPIEKVMLSADGKLLACQEAKDQTTIWDTTTLQPIKTVAGIHRLAGFSPDGEWLLGSNPAFALQRWSVADGKADPGTGPGRYYVVGQVNDLVLGVRIDSDQTVTALSTWSGSRHSFERETPPQLPELKSWEYQAVGAISANGAMTALDFAIRRADRDVWRLQLYDLKTLQMRRQEDRFNRMSALSLSPSAKLLAVAIADTNEVAVEDSLTGETRWHLQIDSNVINTIAFSPDEDTLALGGRNSVIYLVAAQDGRMIRQLRGQNGGVLDVAWSNTGRELFSTGSGGDLRRWENPTAPRDRGVVNLAPAPRHYRSACLSDDGLLFAALDGPDRIRIRGVSSQPYAGRADVEATIPLAFNREGSALLALDRLGRLRNWPLDSAQEPAPVLSLPQTEARVISASLSADQTQLAVSDSAGVVQFWDVPRQKLLGQERAHAGFLWWTNISPSGEFAVTAGSDQKIKIWSVQRGTVLAEWTEVSLPFRTAFDRRGQWLALALYNGDVEIRDLRNFQVHRRWRTDSSTIQSVAFSADGRRLYCGGANGIVHVYDPDDWSEVAILDASGGEKKGDPTVIHLVASANGRTLLAYREDAIVRLWQNLR